MKQELSTVIQGCMTWGSWGKNFSKNEMIQRIHHCMENGITTFDHADIYGDYTTEIDFGVAFKDSGIPRESVQLITKCGIQYVGETRDNPIKHYQYDAEYIVWSAEKSIADLNADYLDIFLLHRPSPLMQPDEIAKAADRLVSEGKIKSFGVSNFTPSQMRLISKSVTLDYNQIEFSLTACDAMTNGSLDEMVVSGIVPMCWSPLGQIFRGETEQTQRIHLVLDELCEKYSAGKDQLALAWIMRHPAGIRPVIGTTDPKRITDAANAARIPLTEIDWFRLWVASMGHKVP